MLTSDSKFVLENILKKTHGLIEIKIKVSIRDAQCLGMVYTPGVATPCLTIQKDESRAYELTNKANAILIVTDSSAKKKKWNNNANMPYLEAISAIYKQLCNIDAYPIICDMALVKDAETLLDTINTFSPAYAGVELFNVDSDRAKKVMELFEKCEYKNKYSLIDGTKKRELDAFLANKNTLLNSHSIFSAVWRAALDCHVFGNLNKILDFVVNAIKSDKLNLKEGKDFYVDYKAVLECVLDYIFSNKLECHDFDKYNWLGEKSSKEFVLKKLRSYLTYGSKAWLEPMPKGYYMHKHDNPENANLLHMRNKGVVGIGLKIHITSPEDLLELLNWDDLDDVADEIVDDPTVAYDLTCKSNYGAIITNGTAILGLGNIGALSGMPVMEGKSVLFKYFGGTNICPLCLQVLDVDKMITYIQRIAPSFSIINLEDIKGPDCFWIENKLIETVECPMFHDDQHGTATVVLAGLINATKLRGTSPEKMKIVMNGAGAAGISVCQLLMAYGFKNFIVCDTAGAIYKGRPKNMNPFKEKLAELTNKNCEKGKLADVLKGADVVIGLSGPNTISQDNVKSMAEKPIVFALANPTPEIYPDQAKAAGAFIVATGRSDFPNQINNSVAFPGIFRGTIDTRAPKITLEMKIAAAEAIAGLVTENELRPDYIMPSSLDINTSIKVATDVAKVVIEKKLTNMKNIDLDKVHENIHSYFIDEILTDVTKDS